LPPGCGGRRREGMSKDESLDSSKARDEEAEKLVKRVVKKLGGVHAQNGEMASVRPGPRAEAAARPANHIAAGRIWLIPHRQDGVKLKWAQGGHTSDPRQPLLAFRDGTFADVHPDPSAPVSIPTKPEKSAVDIVVECIEEAWATLK
jgi:hypothetical protein